MPDYQIYEPTPEEEARRRSHWMYWYEHILAGYFDWIDMAIGELQLATDSRSKRRQRRDGGRLRIVLHREAPHTPREIVELLRRYGVRVRRHTMDGDNFYFAVRSSQSAWAVTVLDRWRAGTLGLSWAEKRDNQPGQGPGLWSRLLGRTP